MEDSVMDDVSEAESEDFVRRAREEMAGFKPAELMDWIAGGEQTEEYPRMALAALHGILEPWLEFRAQRLREICPGPYVSEAELIGETWLRIVRGAGTYKEPEDCQNPTGNLLRWVGTIMRNALAEVRRKRYWEPLCQIPEDENGRQIELPAAFGQAKAIEPSRPELAQVVRDCIQGLRSQQQQVVLWASADYFIYCEERKMMICEPPEEVRARLSEQLGTSDNNICQLRRRALAGLRKCVTNKTGMGR